VLAAPALIEQDELKELILNYEVKKVIVIQSKDDILNLLYATLEQKHKFYSKKISPAGNILIDNLPLNRILGIPLYAENIFLNHPKLINNFLFQLFLKRKYGFTMEISKNNDYHYASFDIAFFLSTCEQKTSILPLKESFWIGGSDRKKSCEFVNWSKNADNNYDIIACDILPNKSINNKVVENPAHLHSRLRDVMVEMFSNEIYPFDGTIEGLSKNYH
jgi:hypothetical protein